MTRGEQAKIAPHLKPQQLKQICEWKRTHNQNDMINGFIFSQAVTEWRRRFFDFEEKIIQISISILLYLLIHRWLHPILWLSNVPFNTQAVANDLKQCRISWSTLYLMPSSMVNFLQLKINAYQILLFVFFAWRWQPASLFIKPTPFEIRVGFFCWISWMPANLQCLDTFQSSPSIQQQQYPLFCSL